MSMSNQPKILGKLFLFASLLVAAGSWAQADENLSVAYAKPGVDLHQYQQFMLSPLDLSETRLVPPPWVEDPDPREWDLTPGNREFLVSTFATAVREGIESDGRFKIVDERSPGTLQVQVRLVSLTPWASRDEQVTTLGSGMLVFEAHIRDAQTAELLAVFKGTQQVGQEYQENSDLNKAKGVKEHFTNWGRNISRRLAKARAD